MVVISGGGDLLTSATSSVAGEMLPVSTGLSRDTYQLIKSKSKEKEAIKTL